MKNETRTDSRATTIAASKAARDIVGPRRLVQLMQRQDRSGLLFALFHFSASGCTGCLLYYALDTAWFYPALLLHGFIIVRFFAPYHEACHGTAFKTRWLNAALNWITGLILMLPPLAFKYEHADHHTYTQDPERDAQYVEADNLLQYLWYGSAIPYFYNIALNLLLQPFGWMNAITRRAVPDTERKKVQWEACIFLCVYTGLALVSIFYQTWAIVVFWLVPRVIMEPVERLIRMTEHVCCAKSPDMMENSRTVLLNPLLSVLSWNMPYHSAHHAAPLVPFHRLAELTELLEGHIKHCERGFLKAIFGQMKTLVVQGRTATELQH